MKTKVQSDEAVAVRKIGVIGGLGALAGADLFYKLTRSRQVLAEQFNCHLLLEQQAFSDAALPLYAGASVASRKFYVYELCKAFEARGIETVMLPCFASHTFLGEIQEQLSLRILDMMAALKQHIAGRYAPGTVLGVLASDVVRGSGLFERYLGGDYRLSYPPAAEQAALMAAVYGEAGIKHGGLDGAPLEAVQRLAGALQAQGAAVIVPGMTELALVCAALQRSGIAMLDSNAIYADFAASEHYRRAEAPFKLGVVGGVGPAATVDFMDKVVTNTPAGKDQDHIKMVVEHNPQIPDRTANLLRAETDPTIALYATCQRLADAGADAIAIPCNTAHAFVARIQPHLEVPIVNMLDETIACIVEQHGASTPVGLLATSGTLQSAVYHEAARAAGLQLITPGHEYQTLVMEAIYGARGIKAGFTEGICKEQLLVVAEHLCELGAGVLILGCTELPLVLSPVPALALGRHRVAVVDPTTVLARACVQLALDARPQDRQKVLSTS
ncbi:aspartate racemase [Pseudomonas sp. UC 17F4]|uniref:amino acid racemase n=1 Tax=Pseudomonas sp. UC 17F4 TaxID=1855328 RepID=UPI00088A084E|nr:amino acid racemase [Pseudomonas sp. UC 17F4]SDQ80662.1 aspartate racemase [Pseudomonas sp. UC 17F4]